MKYFSYKTEDTKFDILYPWSILPIKTSLISIEFSTWISNYTMTTGMLMVSCPKGPTRHAYAWQVGPFWQDTLDVIHGPISMEFC